MLFQVQDNFGCILVFRERMHGFPIKFVIRSWNVPCIRDRNMRIYITIIPPVLTSRISDDWYEYARWRNVWYFCLKRSVVSFILETIEIFWVGSFEPKKHINYVYCYFPLILLFNCIYIWFTFFFLGLRSRPKFKNDINNSRCTKLWTITRYCSVSPFTLYICVVIFEGLY